MLNFKNLNPIRMKKRIIFVIFLIITGLHLSAQKSRDVLYLKNGSIIYGKMMEVSDNQYKIMTTEGSIFIYSAAEVEKFVNETLVFDGRKKSGPGFALEAGLLFGAQSSKYDKAVSFNVLLILTGKTKDLLGMGSGVEFLGQSFMPVFIEYKHLISDKKTTPFIFIRGGKLCHIHGDTENTDATYPVYNTPMSYKGGFTFTLGTGISWSRDGYETYLSFAYRNAYTSYNELTYPDLTTTYKNAYNRLEIKYGFKF